MSTLDFSSLSDLAKAPKAGPKPLTVEDLGEGQVLAFDQSLTATGWVWLGCDRPRGLNVLDAGSWSTKTVGKDVATSLTRGREIFTQARMLLRFARQCNNVQIVHETPPNPAVVKGNGISSLIAAEALWCAAEAEGMTFEMIGAQSAKKLVTGTAKSEKKEAHDALVATVFPWLHGREQITNEAKRDALLVGLHKLHQMK